ncbi:MAG: hypothetical protein V5A88_07415, partial [Candidatus Thermoplasmatota archaeon]
SIQEGLQNKGMSFIEMMSPCTTAYSRQNKMGAVEEFWNWYEEKTILAEEYDRIEQFGSEEEKENLEDKIKIGVLHEEGKESLSERIQDLIEEVHV